MRTRLRQWRRGRRLKRKFVKGMRDCGLGELRFQFVYSEYGGRNFLEARCRGGWRSDSVYACAAGVMRSIFQEEAVSLGRDPLDVTVGSND
jgi:hypothetical protein